MDKPTGAERRLSLRLLAYWEKRRRGRPWPAEADITPEDLRDLWDHCFLIRAEHFGSGDYTHLGTAIAVHEGLLGGITGTWKTHFLKVADTGKPLLEEGESLTPAQETVKYRQCLLPLGQDQRVEAVLGALSFGVFSSKTTPER